MRKPPKFSVGDVTKPNLETFKRVVGHVWKEAHRFKIVGIEGRNYHIDAAVFGRPGRKAEYTIMWLDKHFVKVKEPMTDEAPAPVKQEQTQEIVVSFEEKILDTDPKLHYWAVKVESPTTIWKETFGSEAEARAFERGAHAIASAIGSQPCLPMRYDWKSVSGLR